ncbi:hypothetical protein [Amycolatopsis albispora]|nr:hypothetical protein [Amycolatopsis albispora]
MQRELHQEQAGLLGGVPDLLKRLDVLRSRAEELSPIWGLDFASRAGQSAVFVRLKSGSPAQHIEVHVDVEDDDPAGPALWATMHISSGLLRTPRGLSCSVVCGKTLVRSVEGLAPLRRGWKVCACDAELHWPVLGMKVHR